MRKKGKEGGKGRPQGHGGSEDTVHLRLRAAFIEEDTLGLGLEGRVGTLFVGTEDIHETNLEVMDWRKGNQRQGDSPGAASSV